MGRRAELAALEAEFRKVRRTGRGGFVLVRGRRQVGKSRLVEQFLTRSERPHVFFSATKGRRPGVELSVFAEQVAVSSLPAAGLVSAGARFPTWDAALAVVAGVAVRAKPSVVVIDELPYLVERDTSVEGALATAWDRHLRDAPVLLIVIGSDLAMMSALTDHDRPLYGRPTKALRVPPLTPAEVAEMSGLAPAPALDAYLVVGGFPLLASTWGRSTDLRSFLAREAMDPTSPLFVVGERMVGAEFPPDAQARAVLTAIGSGERGFTAIGAVSGVPRQSLDRTLTMLVDKGVAAKNRPLSTSGGREARYSIVDPYLRFWLRFLEPGMPEAERGRGDLVVERILAGWSGYRGRAVEHLVREAVERLLPDPRLGRARHVGSFWTRTGDVEVDLVGAARPGRPPRLDFVGSIKWRERAPFTSADVAALVEHGMRVPGADGHTLLVGVSRSGFRTGKLDLALGPAELLEAWERPEAHPPPA